MNDKNNDYGHLIDKKTLEYITEHGDKSITEGIRFLDMKLSDAGIPYTFNVSDSLFGQNKVRVVFTYLIDEKENPEELDELMEQIENGKITIDIQKQLEKYKMNRKVSLDYEADR